MLQIVSCRCVTERTRGAKLCISCETKNVLLRMEDAIDRREPQRQLPLVSRG